MSISRRSFVKLSAMAPVAYRFPLSSGFFSLTAPNDALYAAFKDPSNAARPFVRWWWNGSRIIEQELLRELDMLKEKGISGVEINTIAFPAGDDAMGYKPYDWLSDEWINMLKVTLNGAKERGITCDIIMGSGWPFGGEFLKKDEQIQLMALGSKSIKGPVQYKVKKQELLDDMAELSTYKKGWTELYEVRLAPAKMDAFNAGKLIDISAGSDEITIDVPEGDNTLYYLVKLTGYTAVTNGAPGASGPVLNHYNKPAVENYLNRMSTVINAKLGDMGKYFRSVFVDSLELRGSNWCDDLLTEFKRRKGYDLEPYLPFVLFKINKKSTYNGGQLIEENTGFSPQVQDEINRVRYDFETTRLALFHERFLETFVDWCKTNHVKSRVQAHGREYYTLESSMILDIPECETWIRPDVGGDLKENVFSTGRGYRPVNKVVSSAARLTGKNIVSCEEITNTSLVFNATLERIKITGDQSNLSGVTHSILHGFNYSPKDIPFPGWVRYGTFFNERNTWWRYLKNWIDYKARLSAVFQASVLQSDIAVMFPLADMWSKFGLQYQQWPQIVYPEYADNIWEAIHQNGSGCDYLTENILQKSKFSEGKLHYGPRSYKALIMPEIESVSLETIKALDKFAATGGLVLFIGKEPVKSYGKLNHVEQDEQIKIAVQQLKKAHPTRVVNFNAPSGEIINWYAQIQKQFKVTPFVQIDKPVSHVSQTYYKTPQADVFFFTNYHLEKNHQFTASFNVKNKVAWVWDSESGKKYRYPHAEQSNVLNISLDPAQSMLIVFTNETQGELYPIRKKLSSNPQVIDGAWQVTLQKVYDAPKKRTMASLIDFKDDEELQSFAGVAIYEKTFTAEHPQKYNYIDLGKVCGISEVTLNGKLLGFKWYGKHIYDIAKAVKPGNNTLQIKVTTVLGNYAKSLKDNKVAQQWTKAQPLYSAGLLGPVALV